MFFKKQWVKKTGMWETRRVCHCDYVWPKEKPYIERNVCPKCGCHTTFTVQKGKFEWEQEEFICKWREELNFNHKERNELWVLWTECTTK